MKEVHICRYPYQATFPYININLGVSGVIAHKYNTCAESQEEFTENKIPIGKCRSALFTLNTSLRTSREVETKLNSTGLNEQEHFGHYIKVIISLLSHFPPQCPLTQGCVAVCGSECVCMWARASGAMSDPRDIDEDAILRGLSAEELDQLEYDLQEMDPEVLRSAWFVLTCQVVCFSSQGPVIKWSVKSGSLLSQ